MHKHIAIFYTYHDEDMCLKYMSHQVIIILFLTHDFKIHITISCTVSPNHNSAIFLSVYRPDTMDQNEQSNVKVDVGIYRAVLVLMHVST